MDEVKEATAAASAVAIAPEPPEPHPRPPEKTVAGGSEWAKVRALVLKQLDRFISLEPKVLRGDDPEAIHNIRVASRRLQQVLDLLYPPPPPKDIRKVRRVIRRYRRALSEVRNCDVLLDRIGARLAGKRASRREVWTAVRHYLQQRRKESFEKALRKVSKANVAVFYVHARGHLNGNGAGPARGRQSLLWTGEAPARELFYERISQSLERVAQDFETRIVQSQRDRRAPVIHQARIATKRLRYLVEVIREFGVPGTTERLTWLRRLQQQLGDWHDLEVLEDAMIEMVARPEFLREHLELAMGIEKLIVQNRSAKKRLAEKYFRMTLDAPDFRQTQEWMSHVLSAPSAVFATA